MGMGFGLNWEINFKPKNIAISQLIACSSFDYELKIEFTRNE